MNILFDLIASQPNKSGTYHGGGKYAKEVFFKLVDAGKGSSIIYGLFDSKKTLDTEIRDYINQYEVTLFDINENSINGFISKFKIDRFYSALPNSLKEGTNYNCDFIGTVHGLRPLETRMDLFRNKYTSSIKLKLKNILKYLFDSYLYKKNLRKIGKSLTNMRIVAVSNHTKYALLSYFPAIKEDDIKVFYSPDVTGSISGYGHNLAANAGEFTYRNYFLMVSGNRWIKNNLRSAVALDQIFSEFPSIDQQVIITGVKNKNVYLKRLENKERFIFLEYVDEQLLDKLYQNAFALIYMSLNEGFGYPPLEAMKYAKPVIASPLTSIPEVCADAPLYADPFSVKEIKNRILNLVMDESTYTETASKCVNRYKFIKSKQIVDLDMLVNYLLK